MKHRDPLTPIQASTYSACVLSILKHGYAPTLREMAEEAGVSVSTMYERRQVVIERRYLRKARQSVHSDGRSRGLVITEPIETRYVEGMPGRIEQYASEVLGYLRDAAVSGCIEAEAIVEKITGKAGAA